MREKYRRRLSFERLEDRLAPATSVFFDGSNLTVTGTPTGALNITGAAGPTFTVMDGASSFGPYAVTGNIRVSIGNLPDTVLVDLNTQTLAGSLSIDTGNGNDSVIVDDGTVSGDLTVRSGNGADNLILGVGGALVVAGRGLFDLGAGFDFLLAGISSPLTIGGSVHAARANVFNFAFAAGSSIGGSLTIANNSEPALPTTVQLFDGTAAANEIGQNLTVVGGNAQENIVLLGDVAGNVNIVAGEGANTLGINPSVMIGGNLTYTGGGGVDNIGVFGGQIDGSANIRMGNGNNTYLLSFAFSVAGNFTLTAGGGTDNVGTFNAAVGGNLTFTLGHGTNTVSVPATAAVGGTLRYNGGNNLDSLTVTGAFGFALVAYMGAGVDTFEYGAATTVGSAFLDFGVDGDTDVYDMVAPVTVTWPQTIKNYP